MLAIWWPTFSMIMNWCMCGCWCCCWLLHFSFDTKWVRELQKGANRQKRNFPFHFPQWWQRHESSGARLHNFVLKRMNDWFNECFTGQQMTNNTRSISFEMLNAFLFFISFRIATFHGWIVCMALIKMVLFCTDGDGFCNEMDRTNQVGDVKKWKTLHIIGSIVICIDRCVFVRLASVDLNDA